jgi:hypothetical protein
MELLMARETFDGGPGSWSQTEAEVLHSEPESGAPLMTFTLIDGGGEADKATIESEVRAAFGSAKAGSLGADLASATLRSGGSTLRKILGTADYAETQTAAQAIAPQQEAAEEPTVRDESGSLLRPNPAYDRLENDYSVVLSSSPGPAPAPRWWRRLTR